MAIHVHVLQGLLESIVRETFVIQALVETMVYVKVAITTLCVYALLGSQAGTVILTLMNVKAIPV